MAVFGIQIGGRKEELLLDPMELKLINRLQKVKTNAEFLLSMNID